MAWSFDGSSGNYLSTSTALPNYDSAYTMSYWVKINTLPSDWGAQVMLAYDNDNYEIVVTSPGGASYLFVAAAGFIDVFGFTSSISDGNWHHVCIVRESTSSVMAYVDGVLNGPWTPTDARSNGNVSTYVGSFAGLAWWMDFELDSLKIWNVAFDASMVAHEGARRDIAGQSMPLHWYDPVLSSGNKLLDRGTSVAHWTENGSVSLSAGPPIMAYPRSVPFVTTERQKLDSTYAPAREGFLDGSIDWDNDPIKACAITDGYTPDFTNDRWLSDIPAGARVAHTGELSSKTKVLGVAGAAAVVFRSVAQKIEAVVLYKDAPSVSECRLICYHNTALELPTHPHGRDATVFWPSGSFQI
jgi:hypothetical protein